MIPEIILTPEKANDDKAMYINLEEVKTDENVSESDENEAIQRVLNMKEKYPSASPSVEPNIRQIAKKDTRLKNKFKATSPDSNLRQISKHNKEYTIRAEKLKKTCGAFHEVGGDVMVTVETGNSFDLRSV